MKISDAAKTLVLIALVVVLASTALFVVVGGDTEFDRTAMVNAGESSMQIRNADKKAGSVSSLVSGLESRLAKNPDDAKGWLLLARSHDHLGNSNAAWSAYARAKELGISDETFELRLGQSL